MRDRPGVLVVEPDPVLRMMLCRMLVAEAGVRIAGEATDASMAQAEVERLAPDLALVALQLVPATASSISCGRCATVNRTHLSSSA